MHRIRLDNSEFEGNDAASLFTGERTDVTPLSDGETVRAGDETLRAVHAPGHTAGHLCFVREDRTESADAADDAPGPAPFSPGTRSCRSTRRPPAGPTPRRGGARQVPRHAGLARQHRVRPGLPGPPRPHRGPR